MILIPRFYLIAVNFLELNSFSTNFSAVGLRVITYSRDFFQTFFFRI